MTGQTIVTENPYGREAQNLLNYALTAPLEFSEIVDQMVTAYPDGNNLHICLFLKEDNLFCSSNYSGRNECQTSTR